MPCPSPVGDLRSPKWRATRYARPFSLRRRTWVEANLFIRSFLPGGNTYRTFRAPFVKRVAGRTLTAHSNVLRIYVARFPAFPLPFSPGLSTAVTTFPSPFKLTTHSPLPTFLSGHPGLPRGIPPLRWSLSTSPFCKETDFSTPSLTPGVAGGGGGGGGLGGGWLSGGFASEMERQLLINPVRGPPSWVNTYSGCRARGRVSPGSTPYWFALVTRPARHCVRSARVNTRTRSPRLETRARRAIAGHHRQGMPPSRIPVVPVLRRMS